MDWVQIIKKTDTNSATTIRIFISSPGDVNEERTKAQQVIADLQRIYATQALLQPVLWEDIALPATASFQQSIDYLLGQHPIEIAVFILWSRLGSPLGAAITRPDGSPYRSGTEREFDLMLAAFQQSGNQRPLILAYARDDEATWKQSLARCERDHLEEMISQQRLAESFIKEQFHDKDGHNLRAYHAYREPVGFAQRLRTHLRSTLDELLVTDGATTRWIDAPYRSLEVFDIQHAPIFFGRAEEACDVMDRLRKQHDAGCGFVVIVGASGSGKSSLARAGVAAALLEHAYDSQIRTWRTCIFVPSVSTTAAAPVPHGTSSNDLIHGLIKMLCDVLPELLSSGTTLDDIAHSLATQSDAAIKLSLLPALNRAAENAGGEVRVLIVLDQMEELWTDRTISDQDREQFLTVIEALARTSRIDILATLRSDFYAPAQASPTFLRLKGNTGYIDLVAPGTAALQRMIVEPARMAGLQFERDERTGKTLDQAILEDAARDTSALPLVQYALAELYDQRTKPHLAPRTAPPALTAGITDDRTINTRPVASASGSRSQTLSPDHDDGVVRYNSLTFAAYQSMGGVEGAIGKRAAATFAQLSASTQAALNEILPLLVTVDTESEQNAVRRRASLRDLTATPDRQALTQALIAARFLTTDRDGDQSIASLAHEALLRRWESLAKWVNTNRNHLRLRARIEQNQNRWEQAGRDPSLLLSPGLPLEEGRQLRQAAGEFLTPSAAAFVEASIAHQTAVQRRRTKQRNLVLSTLTALTILAIAGGVYSWFQRNVAEQQAEIADKVKIKAQAAESAANEQTVLANTRLEDLKVQAKAASLVLFDYGMDEYLSGRVESSTDKLIRAWRLRGEEDPLKVTYARVLSDKISQGCRSWFVLRHEDGVDNVAFSPDGSRLATATYNKALIWDAVTGAPLSQSMQDYYVRSIAFCPDGSRLATLSSHEAYLDTAIIWDAVTGTRLGGYMQHEGDVELIAFSPDGSRLATTSRDNTEFDYIARIWDAFTGGPVGEPMRHEIGINSIAFSPDGSRLVTASADGIARFWNAVTGLPLGEPMRHEDDVTSIAFSPDFSRLATAADDGTVQIWDCFTGAQLGAVMRHVDTVDSISFSPDGSRLVTGAKDKAARIWDASTGASLGNPMWHDDTVKSVVFSPDGVLLATACDKTARIWDAVTGAPLGSPMWHDDDVISITFSPDCSRLATGSNDKTARIWDMVTGEPLGDPLRHPVNNVSIAFSPDSRRVATVSPSDILCADGIVRIWDAVSGAALSKPMPHDEAVISVVFSPDGSRLGTVSDDDTARLWDATTGAPLVYPMRHIGDVTSIAFSPDNRRIATASRDDTARIWDADIGTPLVEPMRHGNDVSFIIFSPDGTRLASASYDKTARVWDAATGAQLGEPLRQEYFVGVIAFSRDGRRVATASSDYEYSLGSAQIWDVITRAPLGKANWREGECESIAFSPDGTRLVTAFKDNTIGVWDAVTGAAVYTPIRYGGHVESVTFSSDGNRLATTSHDDSGRIVDAVSGVQLGEAMRHETSIRSMAFSPDGRLLATVSDGTTRIWDAEYFAPKNILALINRFAMEPQLYDKEFQSELDAFRSRRNLRFRGSNAGKAVASRNWFAAAFHLPWLCEQEPNEVRWRSMLAQTFAEQGNWIEASKSAERALELKATLESHRTKLLCSLAMKNSEQIEHCVEQLIIFAQASTEAADWDHVAWTGSLCDNPAIPWDRLHTLIAKAVAKDETSAAFRESLGAALYRLGRFEEAEAALIKSIELSKPAEPAGTDQLPPVVGSYYAHVFLALTYHRLNQPEKSAEHRELMNRLQTESPPTEWEETLRRKLLGDEVAETCAQN